jgi:hypothetical protein
MPITLPRPQTVAAISGTYYDVTYGDPSVATFSNTTLTMAANRQYAIPLELPAGSYSTIGFLLGTAAAAGKLVRLSVYSLGANGLPDALIADGSTTLAADAATAFNYEIALAANLVLPQPARIFGSIWSDGAPVVGGWNVAGKEWLGRTALATATRRTYCYKDRTFGAAPASFGAPDAYLSTSIPTFIFKAV